MTPKETAAAPKPRRKAAGKAPTFAPASARRDDSRWTLTVPLRVVSEANQRGFWRKRAARTKAQRAQIAAEWLAAFGKMAPKPPYVVRLTRLGGRALDSDNLAGAFKAVRDELARIVGTDDRSPLYSWQYEQRPGGPVGIRVEIQEGARLLTTETVISDPGK